MALLFWAFAAGVDRRRAVRRHAAQPDRRRDGHGRQLPRHRRDLHDAVRALPRGRADAGLRRRDHGAVRLRHHDPEPARGRAGRTERARRARCSAASRSSTSSVGSSMLLINVALPNAAPTRRRSPTLPARHARRAVRLGHREGGRHRPVRAGLFPFEAISILLLVAVVGAIAIARPLHDDAGRRRTRRPHAGRATP